MTPDQADRLLGTFRGRRLLLCRATGDLLGIIDAMDRQEDAEPRPAPAPSERTKADLRRSVMLLRHMLMGANDGGGCL